MATTRNPAEPTVWCIRAGALGEADPIFKKGYIAIGWEVGDLSQIPNDPEKFRARVAQAYPDFKPGAVPVVAGILRRFAYEVKPGDYVVYPSKLDRQIYVGRVTSDYRYDLSVDREYCDLHRVEWRKTFPRTRFSQGALYEIGGLMTLFQIRNYADEFVAALESKTPSVAPTPAVEDETVPQVAASIEDNTRDYILKRLAQDLKGHPLAHFVAHLLGAMGYRTRVSPPGPDAGVDIIAHLDELGFQPPLIKVQVKSVAGNTGDPEVSSLYGKLGPSEYGLFVTLGSFTPAARAFARGKSNLRLIDSDELIDLILEHYEQFDSRYKAVLSLKRVYVPDPKDANE